jgi:hypothetical protein
MPRLTRTSQGRHRAIGQSGPCSTTQQAKDAASASRLGGSLASMHPKASVSRRRVCRGGVEQRGCNTVVVGDAGQRDLPAARRKLATGRLRADTGGRVTNAYARRPEGLRLPGMRIAAIIVMVGSVTPAFAQSASRCEPAASMAQPIRDSIGHFKALPSRETAGWLSLGAAAAFAAHRADSDVTRTGRARSHWATPWARAHSSAAHRSNSGSQWPPTASDRHSISHASSAWARIWSALS